MAHGLHYFQSCGPLLEKASSEAVPVQARGTFVAPDFSFIAAKTSRKPDKHDRRGWQPSSLEAQKLVGSVATGHGALRVQGGHGRTARPTKDSNTEALRCSRLCARSARRTKDQKMLSGTEKLSGKSSAAIYCHNLAP